MTYDPNNVFAKILRGEIPCDKVYESEYSLAFKDIAPQAPVHTLVIPKGEYKDFDAFSANASDVEIADFIRAVGTVARDAGVEESGYRIISNIGADAIQEVPHLHIHILGARRLGGIVQPADKVADNA